MSRRANLTQSQRGPTQSQADAEPVQVDRHVCLILNFIICHSANRAPIKFSDLTSLTNDRNELLKRLPLVVKLLRERYGIVLVELETAPKRYVCVSEAPAASIYELTPMQRPQYTLLYIVLTYIFIRNNRVEEDKLYAMLDSMNINVHEEHGYFGSHINKLIEETFVKQQYLKRERPELNPYGSAQRYYSWGMRANSEISKEQILHFAARVFDQDVAYLRQQLMMSDGNNDPEIPGNSSRQVVNMETDD